ncbi:transcriptional regulator [Ligilactobacillus agilis]|uniref:helix-turn-helix domain-containing protein n=1 Tax=Ligilactobacillus agilis TaxID=1601 RepID=UPI000B5DB645|nr:helix-turn-helix transcriptional regulator [Ligilactobacillus agilis]MBM6763088.1 helix-turn-helix transcriptional regulator [Ligilactobacillus agilis]OXC07466.1 transcriptional regulator [Ligilactobacillus agilis]OXC11066.1 transcriptional regulator [Ligilactobacillus agilis]OXC11823.1 transcriptional regulator [Ligilactobacillus agilis]OXS37493.1 transcriptional regulator [Ligilactobacillus agilis]
MNTGEIIAKLRNKNKISQSALANDLHIGQSTLAMYEKNKRKPNLEMLSAIADYFNVTTDYLLGRPEKKKEKQNVELTDDDIIMTYQGKELSDEDREIIKRLMNGK